MHKLDRAKGSVEIPKACQIRDEMKRLEDYRRLASKKSKNQTNHLIASRDFGPVTNRE